MSAITPGAFSRLQPGSLWRSTHAAHTGYVYRVRELRTHTVVVEGVTPRHVRAHGTRWNVSYARFLRQHVPVDGRPG